MIDSDDLIAAVQRGRAAWPGVDLELEAFAERGARLQVRAEDLAAHGADLFLAWACAAGDRHALAHFERTYLPQVSRYVARIALARHQIDELQQQLRIRLLTGSDPRIGHYGGRGPLGAWVRVAAVRLALSLIEQLEAGARKTVDLDALDALASDRIGPELSTIKHHYRDSFQAALERSLAALELRQKTILRMHFVDHLNIDAIGKIYRVHRATVARWLVSVRQQVLADVRQELSLELSGTSSELRRMVAAVRDELSLSLMRVLS